MNPFIPVPQPPETHNLPNASLLFWPEIAREATCHEFYSDLLATLPWQQDYITLYGKTLPVPRLQVWMGDPGANYQYSGLTLFPHPWSPAVITMKQQIEIICGHHFNAVLINLYRNGQDSNGWHSDDEPELGVNPVIASFSLGATRRFRLRHKYRKDLPPYALDLPSGSLLLMTGSTQKYWQHCLTKTARPVEPRINLTFRKVVTS